MTKGIIFDIQYNCIYDGPGIRTCVFFKGCPMRCAWCHNPESHLLKPQTSYFAENCAACGACVEACPHGALKLSRKKVVRESGKCEVCGKCAEACVNGVMQIIGKETSAEEIMEKVLRDKIFYDNSGGGVTITGGEATLQPGFLFEILKALKTQGIHTALETCGLFKRELLDNLIENVDLFLYDIKHIDPDIHGKFTGVDNALIQANFTEILLRAGERGIIPRIPLIPGFNTGGDSVNAIIARIKNAGYSAAVHLMPYNSMAGTKWEKIGKASPYKEIGILTEEALSEIVSMFEGAGFEVVCNR